MKNMEPVVQALISIAVIYGIKAFLSEMKGRIGRFVKVSFWPILLIIGGVYVWQKFGSMITPYWFWILATFFVMLLISGGIYFVILKRSENFVD